MRLHRAIRGQRMVVRAVSQHDAVIVNRADVFTAQRMRSTQ
jgi:hypothetical protein